MAIIAGFSISKEYTTMKRVKEQVEMYGVDTLSTLELLAYVLGNNTSQKGALVTAEKLLATYNLNQLQTADWTEMMSHTGLSKAQAQRLHVVCELARRLAETPPEKRVKITSSFDAAMLLKPMMMHLDHEEMRVLLLDIRNQVVANLLMYKGTVNSSILRSAEIFKAAVVRKCPMIIIAHNHPSGDPIPSDGDIEITKQLVASGELLDIEVLDHLIIGNPRFVSLKQHMAW
jgi:DNA repair protein RadC